MLTSQASTLAMLVFVGFGLACWVFGVGVPALVRLIRNRGNRRDRK